MDLGKRFKRYRERKGLTQGQAAELIGINSYQIGNYETNRSEPNISILKKMSEIYEVSIDTLVGNFQFKDGTGTLHDYDGTNIEDYAEQLKMISDELKKMNKIK